MASNLSEAIAHLFPDQWDDLTTVPAGQEAAVKNGLTMDVTRRAGQLFKDPEVETTAVVAAEAELSERREVLEKTRMTHDQAYAALKAAEGRAMPLGKGQAWRIASAILMVMLSMGFGAITIPTLEVLVFTDSATGLPVPHAAAWSWVAGMGMGLLLCAVSLYAAEQAKIDANPENDGTESLVKYGPLIAGLIMLLAFSAFRIGQIGLTMGVVGLILAELVLVIFIEVVSWFHNQLYSRRTNEFPALFAESLQLKDRETQELQTQITRLEGDLLKISAKYQLKQLAADVGGDETKLPKHVRESIEPLLDARLAMGRSQNQ